MSRHIGCTTDVTAFFLRFPLLSAKIPAFLTSFFLPPVPSSPSMTTTLISRRTLRTCFVFAAASTAIIVGLSACSGGSNPQGGEAKVTASVSASALAEAKGIYDQRCAVCHGATGVGDGAAAAALNPKPRDLSQAAWQDSVNDAHIEKIIAEGGPAVGKSPSMPPNPDLATRPDVISGLRQVVRNLRK